MNASTTFLAIGIGLAAFPASAALSLNEMPGARPLNETVKAWGHRGVEKSSHGFDLSSGAPLNHANMLRAAAPFDSKADLDDLSTIQLPDGTFWYYTSRQEFEYIPYEYYTDRILKSFVFDIYDADLNLVGSVADDVEYRDNEYKIASLELSNVVTAKFFNSDDKYELLFGFSYNTDTPGENTYYTRVYSLNGAKDEDGKDKVIYEIPGMLLVDAVNASIDTWSENFYLTFLGEEYDLEAEEWIDYLEAYKMVLHTYKKGGYAGEPILVAENKIAYCHLPGDQADTPCMVSWADGGRAFFSISQYEQRYFEDPTGMSGNDNPTDNNFLLANIYSIGGSEKEFSLVKSISVPVVQTPGEGVIGTFYAIGNLDYDGDFMRDGDKWTFVLNKHIFTVQEQDERDSYYVIDEDGNVLTTIFENAEAGYRLSDVNGCETQFFFVEAEDGDYQFHFVNVPSGEEMFSTYSDRKEASLTVNCDRTGYGDSYRYAFKASNPEADAEENNIERIVWLDADGNTVRVDRINLGQDIAYASVYLSQEVLNPYFYNADDKMEYMYLVKRYSPDGMTTREELIVANTEEETLLNILPDERGVLRSIIVVPGAPNAMLQVVYTDYDKYFVDYYRLPLDSFAGGGSGTAADPYIIESVGDLQQMGASLSAHYRLGCDIDAIGYDFIPVAGEFHGTLDGDGHTISNLSIDASAYSSGIFSALSSDACVKNLRLENVAMHIGDHVNSAAVIAGRAMEASVENVHINGLHLSGRNSFSLFGGILATATIHTSVKECSVSNADINVRSQVGGIVGDMRTGSVIAACSFSGSITGGAEVGGIVATSVSGDEMISDCHVTGTISGIHSVGGIGGYMSRTLISRCVFEGEIEARGGEETAWGDLGPRAGGIVGVLTPCYADGGDGVRISSCVAILSRLEGYTPTMAQRYDNEQNTLHAIVGMSHANFEPEIKKYDSDDKPVYGAPCPDEKGLENNYVVFDSEGNGGTDHRSVDGLAISTEDLCESFWNGLGYGYGESVDTPWKAKESGHVKLYFESDATGVATIGASQRALRILAGSIVAPGQKISVYSLSGACVAAGFDAVSVEDLPKGVYVAASSGGARVKFVK